MTETYRYRHTGGAPAVFSDLTAYGIGEVEPGEEIETPFPIVNAALEPVDDTTGKATAALEPEPVEDAAEEEVPSLDDVPDGTVDQVLAWVDGDPARAATALGVENAAEDGPRTTLVEALTRIANTEEH